MPGPRSQKTDSAKKYRNISLCFCIDALKSLLCIEYLKHMKTEHLSLIDYQEILDNTIDDVNLEVLELGFLKLSSGKVAVCDPLIAYEEEGFNKEVPTGEFSVKVYNVKEKKGPDCYALAQLQFTTEKAVKWVLAIQDEDDINELEDEEDFLGFAVDAGIACFMDAETVKLYDQFVDNYYKENPDGNIYDDFFAAEFKKNARNPRVLGAYGDWINFTIPGSDANIVMFQSGGGDGVYPAYWGIDASGKVTSLIIDFLVLFEEE